MRAQSCPAPGNNKLEDAAEIGIQWNAFVELLPLWLAPNMVTLLGFMCILFNIGLLVVMIPDLEGPVRPAWHAA